MHEAIKQLEKYSDEWYTLSRKEEIFVPKCEVLGYCPENDCCGRKEMKRNA